MTPTSPTTYWCEAARLPDGVATGVRVSVHAGRITRVEPGRPAGPGDERLRGLVLPGLANAHSHAFHRALRGRTHDRGGTFWTWRQRMYAVAARLDPDSYLALARATYAEMTLAGITAVGEFHYLHHAPGGTAYADPNAMGAALVQAAADAGIRLTLLDTCYLAGGLTDRGHQPLDEVQQRFADDDADAWATRQAARRPTAHVRHAAAVHSVRAVPADQLATVRDAAGTRPLHVHLSEQPAENAACQAFHGLSPTELLAEHGLLGPTTTAVHATHVGPRDLELLAGSGTTVCACPTTEADLADGIGPFGAFARAGIPLCLGSDQHAATDLLAEARALEWFERLATGKRGAFAPASLVTALTGAGHESLGWDDAGRIAPGRRADLVAIDAATPRTAGTAFDQLVMSATAADVRTVIVDGRTVVRDGHHRLGDVGELLTAAISPLWEDS